MDLEHAESIELDKQRMRSVHDAAVIQVTSIHVSRVPRDFTCVYGLKQKD